MNKYNSKFNSKYAVHLGETLKEWIEEQNMSIQKFSELSGINIERLKEILYYTPIQITNDELKRISDITSIPYYFWEKKRSNYIKYILDMK